MDSGDAGADAAGGPDGAGGDAPDGRVLLARGARWLTRIPATLAFCTLLTLVFLVELAVWETLGFEAFVYLFVADADPAPAWVLAAVAHSPVRPLHLLTNLALLLAFGGLTERRLRRGQYVALLAAAGLGSTAAQVASYALNGAAPGTVGTLGASGVGLAATAFLVVAGAGEKLATGRWRGEATWVWVLTGAFILGRRVVVDFVVGVPGVGAYGHLGGTAVGAAAALWWVSGADG